MQNGVGMMTSAASQETAVVAAKNYTMESSIQHLIDLHINFVALDFDLTVIDVHTGGRWKKSAEELARQHVRPEFRQFILSCLNNNQHDTATTAIYVSIVTFTPQTHLVQHVMENIVGDVERARSILIRGEDNSWSYPHPVKGQDETSLLKGKQAHMASAVEEILTKNTRGAAGNDVVEITKSTMLLIDDDERNIRYAAKNGIRGILFNPDQPNDLIRDLARLA
jgi:hypothetical protein